MKAAIVLTPSYSVAYLSDKMVYVVPTLAAAGMFAATIETRDVNRLLDDDDGGDDEDGDSENGGEVTQNQMISEIDLVG